MLLAISSLLCALLKMAFDSSTTISGVWYLRDVVSADRYTLPPSSPAPSHPIDQLVLLLSITKFMWLVNG